MNGEGRLKSAYELAMERLRAREGTVDGAELTEEQKAQIAAARAEFKARIDELEFLHRGRLAKAAEGGDANATAKLQNEFEREKARLEEQRDERIRKIRGSS